MQPQPLPPPRPPPPRVWPIWVAFARSLSFVVGGNVVLVVIAIVSGFAPDQVMKMPGFLPATVSISELSLLAGSVFVLFLIKDAPAGWKARVAWHPERFKLAQRLKQIEHGSRRHAQHRLGRLQGEPGRSIAPPRAAEVHAARPRRLALLQDLIAATSVVSTSSTVAILAATIVAPPRTWTRIAATSSRVGSRRRSR